MLVSKGFARRRAYLAAALVAFTALTLGPSAAQAEIRANAGVNFAPTVVRVGQSGTGFASVGNSNTDSGGAAPTDPAQTNVVCNAGVNCPAAPEIEGISVIPACQATGPNTTCAAGAEDPDVITINSPASGSGSCAGVNNFQVDKIADVPNTGRYRFTPLGASNPVQLPGFGSTCTISFTYTVNKMPRDAAPGTPSVETIQIVGNNQVSPAIGPLVQASGRGSNTNQTFLKAQPTIDTIASADILPGGSLTDQATVSGLVSPVPGAEVRFDLFGPNNAGCAGAPVFTSTKTVTLSGTTATATSDAYTPPAGATGTYRWIATYLSDANNAQVAGTCGLATETRNVTPPPPPPPPPGVTPPPPPPGVTPPPPPGVTPPPPPPPIVCTPPPGPAPAGGKLCVRGTAAIKGTTGCAGTPFRVVVRGRQIDKVVFTFDGKRVKTLTRPNRGVLFVLPVNPTRLRTGVHRIIAKTTFNRSSGTKARTLRVTFSKCARRAVSPAFTG